MAVRGVTPTGSSPSANAMRTSPATPQRRTGPGQGVSFMPFPDLGNPGQPTAAGAAGSGQPSPVQAGSSAAQPRSAPADIKARVATLQALYDQTVAADADQHIIDSVARQLEGAKDLAHAAQPVTRRMDTARQ
eukprot:9220549-Lingulodinium_polyedra.AAC.1